MVSRNAISLAAYGISDLIKEKAFSYLDDPLKDVVIRWENRIKAY